MELSLKFEGQAGLFAIWQQKADVEIRREKHKNAVMKRKKENKVEGLENILLLWKAYIWTELPQGIKEWKGQLVSFVIYWPHKSFFPLDFLPNLPPSYLLHYSIYNLFFLLLPICLFSQTYCSFIQNFILIQKKLCFCQPVTWAFFTKGFFGHHLKLSGFLKKRFCNIFWTKYLQQRGEWWINDVKNWKEMLVFLNLCRFFKNVYVGKKQFG